MKIPCCQPPTEKNIEFYLSEIEKEKEETGREYILVKNLGGNLEVVPKQSLDFIKISMPRLVIYGNQ